MAVWIHLSQDNIGLDDAKQRGVVDRQRENKGGRFGMVSRITLIDRWVFTGMITRLKFHRSRENISSSEGKNGIRDFERDERGGFNSVIMHEKIYTFASFLSRLYAPQQNSLSASFWRQSL